MREAIVSLRAACLAAVDCLPVEGIVCCEEEGEEEEW
jgi:hypothetical protein